MDLEFFVNLAQVRVHCPYTDAQQFGNFFIDASLAQQIQNFTFARRQVRDQRAAADGSARFKEVAEIVAHVARDLLGKALDRPLWQLWGLDPARGPLTSYSIDCADLMQYVQRSSGRSAAWLAHLHGVQGVVGSNPAAPTNSPSPKVPLRK